MIEMSTFVLKFLRNITSMALLSVLVLFTACTSMQNSSDIVSEVKQKPKGMVLDGDLLYELLAAEFAGNAGDLETSVNFYQKAAGQSDDSRIAARAAYIALYNKQYESVLGLLDRWRELDPGDQDINRIYAVSYLKLHRPKEAVPYIRTTLMQDEASNKEKAMAVKQLLGEDIAAEDSLVLLEALNKEPANNPQMLILQAKFAAQLEQFEKSIELLDRALEIDASLIDVHLIKSRIYRAQGNRDASKEVIKKLLHEHPDNLNLRMQYARMLVEDKEYDMASEQYLQLKKKQPDNVEVVLNLALLYIETDRLDEAAELLAHLVELDKKTDISHYYLGRIAQIKGLHKKAIAQYLKVKNGAYAFEAKLRIASLFARLERVDESLDLLEALAEETEEWSEKVRVYLTQGEIFRSRQRYKDAFDMYSSALKHNREDIDLLYARALIAEKVDRVDIAESDLLKVLSIEPKNSDALNALGYTLADKTKRYQEAKEYILKAAALVPDDPAIMDSLGWISYRMGELQEALKWLSRAFEKLVDAEIAAHYGEVLWQANQKDKAREIWKKGQAVNAKHPVLMETLKRFKP